jgi:2-deoxy-D-gluconate 3-dehydrogenase
MIEVPISPGYSATENTVPLRTDLKRVQAILERIPAGRWGAPDNLKGVKVFLVSTASDYMHGAILLVDGVWLTR